ncbi:hypothetical protein G7Y89_g10046 [Cudoniella acicularis]|uniref:O-methyltransferase C-terminal domain-containing protein n=1 Tax=Cudoniella acicularis TaxID=354080 RepID=A0A8H4RH74_9HELO|nr:hypothetical protein G7Y89_g10046 [Cudoniella acicularis]
MPPTNRIVELASIISEHTSKVDAYLISHNLPTPSFNISYPPKLPLPAEIQASRDAVLEATDELTALMLGPIESLIPPPNSWICVTAIQRFGIATSFPPTTTSTFPQIATACSLSESDTRRILRQAMAFYIFYEPSPGIVAHTASSKALAEIPPVGAFIGFVSEEMLPASTRLVDAMQKWPGSEEPNQAGFALTYETDIPMFDVVSRHPRRAQQMGKAMSFMHSRPGESVRFLLECFKWGAIATTPAVLVDVGGAKGTVAMEIARSFPEMKCVVQDTPEVIEGSQVPEDLQEGERLWFMPHDFFQEQPVKGADIYLVRNVLHDWSDKYAIRILQNLIKALKKGARVLVVDRCLPAPGVVSPYQSRQASIELLLTLVSINRCHDLYMKGIQNARERDPDDWAQFFESADPRFRFHGVDTPKGSILSFMCATWEGEDMF